MRAADRLGAGFRQAEVAHLAGADQLPDRARHVLHRHVRVNAVLIEEVEAVGLQAPQGVLGNRAYALRPAVHARLRSAVLEAELGRDDDLIADGRQGLAHHVLVGAVGLGGVEERHPARERLADQRDGLRLVQPRAVAEAQSHAAEAESRDLRAILAEFPLLHRFAPQGCGG